MRRGRFVPGKLLTLYQKIQITYYQGCEHNEDGRALEGVYTFYELLKALQRGYRVLRLYEVSLCEIQ